MNILIPHNWLLEHLGTQATPEEIQRLLSLSGPSVERIYEIEGESVYDIEVTTNRVDSMSVRGIAREAGVILTQAGISAKLKTPKLPQLDQANGAKPILAMPEIINDPKLCSRIMCMVITNVERIASPDWMQKRLRQIGVNVHDSVIDITNYVTHEYGHPCHAFDYDRILANKKINIVEATKGEEFTIIDGTEYKTLGGEVVFKNDQGEIIDLPAIKGTANTSINEQTKNVLFWIESIDHKKVRFASMGHAIRTVAAQLEEKDLSPSLADDTFARGIELFATLSHGNPEYSTYLDIYPKPKVTDTIQFNIQKVTDYLGVSIDHDQIQSILVDLGCEVKISGSMITVTPPVWRTDLNIAVDIIEEIARIYGYHNLPNTLMQGAIPTNRQTGVDFDLEHLVKEIWSTLGAIEVYTYSMISEAIALVENKWVATGSDLAKTHIKLKNPLTDELVYLRRTLWASHLDVIKKNSNLKNITIFEFANCYIPTADMRPEDWQARGESQSKDANSQILPFEEFHLTLTTNGDLRRAKGMVDALLKRFYLPSLSYKTTKDSSATTLLSGEVAIGNLITSTPGIAILDLDWKSLLRIIRKYPELKSQEKFTPITEDLTFTMNGKATMQDVTQTMRTIANVSEVKLTDLYKQNATFALKYQNDERQLTSEDANQTRASIINLVESKHGAKLVGKIA